MSIKNQESIKKKKIIKNIDLKKIKKKINFLVKKKKKLKKKIYNSKKKYKKKIKNIKLRCNRQIDSAYKFSLEKIISSLLPIFDSLEMAISSIGKFEKNNKNILEKLIELKKFFLKIFSQNSIKIVDKTNVPFDPTIHQAMFVKHSKDIKKDHVIEILQKGYLIHNRLLRAALVSVSNT
ncbi:MAG: nucleotide exchange factor GrpE [Buchnera aphidicola (Periphyllus acericola)]|uniref:nucleotide exchange factor GrpE n=1 Tax=Buchnera aphidicola TaxID=9 RepID=UPI0030CD8E8F|nr:nucleotide exchange factor GrpE [Buchnera aphidicola (Periphyllus acericola)]